MKEFVIYLIKSGICISAFLLIYQLFLRNTTFFRFNRGYLMFGLLASAVAPLIEITYDVPMPFITTQAMPDMTVSASAAGKGSEIGVWEVLAIVYAIGIALLLMRNVLAGRKLSGLIKKGTARKEKGYRIVDSEAVKSPFSVLNLVALNSRGMSDIEKDLILRHELTHINQRHWIDLLCSECMLMLQWFNPLMWIYVILQKENHEFLADEAVISEGVSPAIYQAVLVNQQFRGPVFSFANSFNYSNHLNRLIMIKKRKSAAWKRLAVLILVPAFGVFFWVSAQPRYVAEEFVMTNITATAEDSVLLLGENVVKIKDEKGNDILLTADSITIVRDGNMSIIQDRHGNENLIEKAGNNIAVGRFDGKNDNKSEFEVRGLKRNTPLIIVDDVKSTDKDILSKISPDDIHSVSILKDKSATDVYGEEGRNGVVIVTTKAFVKPKVENGLSMRNIPAGAGKPMVIKDGKEISYEAMEAIDSRTIESISILKDKSATDAYGEKAKNGVILIVTKNVEKQ